MLTSFLLRDAGLPESVVHSLINAQVRLEQVGLQTLTWRCFSRLRPLQQYESLFSFMMYY